MLGCSGHERAHLADGKRQLMQLMATLAKLSGRRYGQEENDSDSPVWPEAADVIVSHESELQLIRNLIRLPDILNEVETFKAAAKGSRLRRSRCRCSCESQSLKVSQIRL